MDLYAYTALLTSILKIKFSVPTRLVNSFVTQPSSLKLQAKLKNI